MPPEFELPAELAEFENRLRSRMSGSISIQRDELLYRAGFAAGKGSRPTAVRMGTGWIWPVATLFLGVISLLLAWQRHPVPETGSQGLRMSEAATVTAEIPGIPPAVPKQSIESNRLARHHGEQRISAARWPFRLNPAMTTDTGKTNVLTRINPFNFDSIPVLTSVEATEEAKSSQQLLRELLGQETQRLDLQSDRSNRLF